MISVTLCLCSVPASGHETSKACSPLAPLQLILMARAFVRSFENILHTFSLVVIPPDGPKYAVRKTKNVYDDYITNLNTAYEL